MPAAGEVVQYLRFRRNLKKRNNDQNYYTA